MFETIRSLDMEDNMMSAASYTYGKDHEAMNIVTEYEQD